MAENVGNIARDAETPVTAGGRAGPIRFPDRPASMWDWADLLPVAAVDAVSLGEGMTPLLRSRLPFGAEVIWKNEARNPTGSQKDRAMSLAISHARTVGASAVVVASTGSAGLSCAAYAARAGLPCVVLVPRGTPRERMLPISFFGARVIEVDGSFEAIEEVLARLDPACWYQASTLTRVNPVQAEAPKTIAFEILHQLGAVPDWVAVPIGGGATIHGVWRGFVELRELGRTDRLPRLIGIQPARFDAVHRAFHTGKSSIGQLRDADLPTEGETVLRNLKHRIPPDGDLALAAVRASGGTIVTVSDEAALKDQARLAALDGVFCEPSSAVVVAAIEQLIASSTIGPIDRVMAVITGSAFRELQILPNAAFPTVAPSDVLDAMVG